MTDSDHLPRTLPWIWLGRVGYVRALGIQRWLRDEVIAGRREGALLLLEHPPTLTQGRHGRDDHITASPGALAALGVEVHRVERGGDVTYHGPGQLVGYPVMRVEVGVRRFVAALAEAGRRLLSELGVACRWDDARPGLWAAQGKIGAVGLHVARGVAIHGIALNIAPDLAHFGLIVPCGLVGTGVTSVAALLGDAPPLQNLAAPFARAFADTLGEALPSTVGRLRPTAVVPDAFLAEADAALEAS